MLRNMRSLVTTILVVSLSAATLYGAKEEDTGRLKAAAETLTELNTKISKDLANKAVCAIVVPSMKKGGFIVGGKYGRGFASCRSASGGWTAPAGMKIEGGSFGLQVGGASSDVVILVMNKSGMEKLLKSKFTLGGDATAAAGPVGRGADAQTDAMMHAEILSWSRSRGAFVGISLEGATLRPDNDDNEKIYHRHVTQREILTGTVTPPASSSGLYDELNRYAPYKKR